MQRANLATLVEEFRRHATETAVVAHRGNRAYRTTYGELASLAGRFAAELERRGVAPGDRVVLWGANSAEWIAAFFGCLLRAAIVVPLDAAGTAEFAERVIAETTPKLLVGDAHLLASRGQIRATPPSEDLRPAPPQVELATLREHLPSEPLFSPSPAIGPHTPFQIVFTSGTTAEPRGIVHTHRNILVSLQPIEDEMQRYLRYERIFHPLRFLHALPLSHVFGQFMGLWCPALLAAEVHFAEELEPSRVAALLKRERISVLIAVPRVLALLRAYLLQRFPALPAQLAASHPVANPASGILRRWWQFREVHRALGWKFWAVISGGARLPAELESFWNRLGFALIQGYGMTETAALVTLNHPFHIKEGSIGKPMPGREVRVSGDGEILVRGDMLAEATWSAGALHRREGEWLATGDLAEVSESGDLKFLGRKGDVIVTAAGLNIHPADLEAALAAQPGIRAAAVVGCELAQGPEPVAVLLTGLGEADAQAAVAAANRSLAEYQQMRRFLRWPEPEFPYTSTGKLVRRRVAAWACAQIAASSSASGSPAPPSGPEDALLAAIASVTGEPAPAADDPNSLRLSEDLHLDSLGRVQLQTALEQRFGVDLDDDAVATAQTLGELRSLMGQYVAARPSGLDSPGVAAATGDRLGQDSTESATRAPVETHAYPRWPWSWPVRAIRIAFQEAVARPLIWLLAAPRVRFAPGAQAEIPDTPLLVIANHITEYDGALIINALPLPLRHRIAAAMSGEMLLDYRHARNQGNRLLNLLAPGAYWLLTALYNVFPLPRAQGFRASFAHAGEAMDRGYSVLIFPEGSRSRTGHMEPFRPGIGLLAQQSRVPVLPVALVGLYAFRPPPGAPQGKASSSRVSWFHSGSIEVRIGRPIPAPAADANAAALTAQLEAALRELLDEDSAAGKAL